MNQIQSPFKFLDAYTKDDKNVFFGRDKEISQLYQLVLSSPLVLVYGFSGIGKTSLIRCGLENKFEPSDWLPLFIRKDDDIIESISEQIQENSLSAIPNLSINEEGDEVVFPIIDKLRILYKDHFKPVYLIFDQFEELFILGKEQERLEFFRLLKEILESDLQVRMIISMREEYIARLSTYEDLVPALFENRMRVEAMSREQVKVVIEKSCQEYGIEIEDGDNTLKKMIDNLSESSGLIELSYLQIYLDRLYKESVKLGEERMINEDLLTSVGSLRGILSDFLNQQLTDLERDLEKKGVKDKGVPQEILFELITQDQTKRRMEADVVINRITNSYAVSKENIEYCIEELKRARIIKEVS
ncbi:MAG: AAA family ATPase [Bacteroidia bacterium]|nr:AAA family ATPase [Bacteroidia bacterium]